MKNPGFSNRGQQRSRKVNRTPSGITHAGEAAIKHYPVHFAKLRVTPAFELRHLFGNEHFDGLRQFLLEQCFVKTHLLKDGFDVLKHRKHGC